MARRNASAGIMWLVCGQWTWAKYSSRVNENLPSVKSRYPCLLGSRLPSSGRVCVVAIVVLLQAFGCGAV